MSSWHLDVYTVYTGSKLILISVFVVFLVLKNTVEKKGRSRPKFTLDQTKTNQAEWFYLLKCHQFCCQCFVRRQQCKFSSKWLRNSLREQATFHQSWNDPIHGKYWKALVLPSSKKVKHFWKTNILKTSNAPTTRSTSFSAKSVIRLLRKATTHMQRLISFDLA